MLFLLSLLFLFLLWLFFYYCYYTVGPCARRLQQGDAREGPEELLQAILGELGHLWQHKGGHCEVGEGQGGPEMSSF